jgi:porphobilinogen synthase
MYFPTYRPRRLRRTPALRALVRETDLAIKDMIYPMFIIHGTGVKNEISSMPGQYQLSLDMLEPEIDEIVGLGIPAVILFGLPEMKDEIASGAYHEDGIVQLAVRRIKELAPELIVITDLCLCEYTSHGHCGIIRDGEVLNDVTIELLARTAVVQAEAGADIVAPSDMMDGRVAAIRGALDAEKFSHIPIMSYSSKYASSYYGPFREAAESAPAFGDRRSYQMDPANAMEALRETAMDVEEGADILMVKPALAYLDIIAAVRAEFDYPLAAYNVSGEYSLIKAGAAKGWIDERNVTLETLTSIKRAGADMILTYHAKDAARWLAEETK